MQEPIMRFPKNPITLQFRIPIWIVTLALTLCGLSPGASFGADKPAAKDAPAAKPLASDKIKNGIVVEVWRVFLSSDALLEVQWGYRNPTAREVVILNRDEAATLMRDTYLIDPKEKNKYHIAEFAQKADAAAPAAKPKSAAPDLQSSEAVYTTLQPGESVLYWAKFSPPPAGTKEISLYLPNAPPLEDLPIAQPAAQAPPDPAAKDQPLATQQATSGLRIEISRVRRTSDGFIEVRWEYSNPHDRDIILFNVDAAKAFPAKLFLEDPAAKIWYPVTADDKSVPVMAPSKYTVIPAQGSETMWAKFKLPNGVKKVSLYMPHALPFENLPVTEKK
jgi:hypothetical protein